MPRCPNCSTEFSGEFCSSCGQQRFRPEALSARHFLRDLADEVVQLRFRFKTCGASAGFASLIETDRSGELPALVDARMAERGLDRALFSDRFDRRLRTVYTLSAGAGVLASALALQVLFRRKGLPFGAHLVFGCHYVSFQYLVTSAAGASRRLGLSVETASAIALGLTAVYILLALKRVYPELSRSILLKTVVVLTVTLVVNYCASLATILITLRLV